MQKIARTRTMLLVDDDADDCLLVQEALRETGYACDMRVVRDGVQLMDYLRRRGEFADEGKAPRPDLILLDLKMPKKDGREALKEVKADSRLRTIPIVVLTTSMARDDVSYCYKMGVNAYMTKPPTFRGLVELIGVSVKYWFDLVELPAAE